MNLLYPVSTWKLVFSSSTPGPKRQAWLLFGRVFNENGKWKPGRKVKRDNIMASYSMTEQTSKNQTGYCCQV